jgi:excisionase family DNA binding protein
MEIGTNYSNRKVNTSWKHTTVWLTEKEVASRTSLSLSKLRQDRHKCRGIPYSKVGRSVRYSLADVEAFMESNKVVLWS